jgi:hypothetical protein
MWSYIKPIIIVTAVGLLLYFVPLLGKRAGQSYFDAQYPDNEYMQNGPMGRGFYYRMRAGKGGK